MAVDAPPRARQREPRLARRPLCQQAAHQGHAGGAVQLGELPRPRAQRGRRAREAGDAAERGFPHSAITDCDMRFAAISQYASLTSIPMALTSKFFAARKVVPDPIKGSRTGPSPRLAATMRVASPNGNGAGCSTFLSPAMC